MARWRSGDVVRRRQREIDKVGEGLATARWRRVVATSESKSEGE